MRNPSTEFHVFLYNFNFQFIYQLRALKKGQHEDMYMSI